MTVSMATIRRATADVFHVRVEDILGLSRLRRFAEPRQVAMKLSAEIGKSTTVIGRDFGRDHTTVMNAIRRVDQRCSTDPPFALRVALARDKAKKYATSPEMTDAVEDLANLILEEAGRVIKKRIKDNPLSVLKILMET